MSIGDNDIPNAPPMAPPMGPPSAPSLQGPRAVTPKKSPVDQIKDLLKQLYQEQQDIDKKNAGIAGIGLNKGSIVKKFQEHIKPLAEFLEQFDSEMKRIQNELMSNGEGLKSKGEAIAQKKSNLQEILENIKILENEGSPDSEMDKGLYDKVLKEYGIEKSELENEIKSLTLEEGQLIEKIKNSKFELEKNRKKLIENGKKSNQFIWSNRDSLASIMSISKDSKRLDNLLNEVLNPPDVKHEKSLKNKDSRGQSKDNELLELKKIRNGRLYKAYQIDKMAQVFLNGNNNWKDWGLNQRREALYNLLDVPENDASKQQNLAIQLNKNKGVRDFGYQGLKDIPFVIAKIIGIIDEKTDIGNPATREPAKEKIKAWVASRQEELKVNDLKSSEKKALLNQVPQVAAPSSTLANAGVSSMVQDDPKALPVAPPLGEPSVNMNHNTAERSTAAVQPNEQSPPKTADQKNTGQADRSKKLIEKVLSKTIKQKYEDEDQGRFFYHLKNLKRDGERSNQMTKIESEKTALMKIVNKHDGTQKDSMNEVQEGIQSYMNILQSVKDEIEKKQGSYFLNKVFGVQSKLKQVIEEELSELKKLKSEHQRPQNNT